MSDQLMNDLNKFKSTYYTDNKKNVIFNKNSQKYDLAEKMCAEYGFEPLIAKTIYAVPETNRVFFDYPIFKLFAHPTIYPNIVDYAFAIFTQLIQTYGSFEFHVNMDTFTVTAAERYKKIIELFCRNPAEGDIEFTKFLTKIYIYNTPGMIDNMIQMISHLIDPQILSIVVRYPKQGTYGKCLQGATVGQSPSLQPSL